MIPENGTPATAVTGSRGCPATTLDDRETGSIYWPGSEHLARRQETPRRHERGRGMQFRMTRMVVLVAGLAVATGACGKYSIGSIRSLKAFKDGAALYEKGDYERRR